MYHGRSFSKAAERRPGVTKVAGGHCRFSFHSVSGVHTLILALQRSVAVLVQKIAYLCEKQGADFVPFIPEPVFPEGLSGLPRFSS